MKPVTQESFINHSWNVNNAIVKKSETEKEIPKIDKESKTKSKNEDSLSIRYKDSTKPIGGKNVGPIEIRIFDSSFVELNKQKPKETVMFSVNGILNDEKSAEKTKDIIENIAGKKVTLIHNPTKMLGLHDIAEASVQLLNDSSINKIDRKVENQIYDALKSGKSVKIVAHSQGAAITADALNAVKNRLLEDSKNLKQTLKLIANVEVLTIGGFANRNDFPNEVKVTEIKNSSDPIPVIGQNIFSSNIDDIKFQLSAAKNLRANDASGILSKAIVTSIVAGASVATKVDRFFVVASNALVTTPVVGIMKLARGKNIVNEHSAIPGYLEKDVVKQAIKDFAQN